MTWNSLMNQFKEYEDRVVGSFRFGQDPQTRDFIKSVLATAEERNRHIEAGRRFWRAQLGHDNKVGVADGNGEWAYNSTPPHTRERMTPSPTLVKNGRANPVGIAYWYAATDPETALAEMRPWQGAVLTVAELTATRKLRLVDFGNTSPPVVPGNSVESTLGRFQWKWIGDAFSKPIAPETAEVAYVPTQLLAEAFRLNGFDGIQYKSHLGKGMNVVVFDSSAFEIGTCELWKAKRVSYKFEPHGEEIRED